MVIEISFPLGTSKKKQEAYAEWIKDMIGSDRSANLIDDLEIDFPNVKVKK